MNLWSKLDPFYLNILVVRGESDTKDNRKVKTDEISVQRACNHGCGHMCQHYLWLFISVEGRAGFCTTVKRTNPVTKEPAQALITHTIVTSLPPDHMTIFISSYILLFLSLSSNHYFLSFSMPYKPFPPFSFLLIIIFLFLSPLLALFRLFFGSVQSKPANLEVN